MVEYPCSVSRVACAERAITGDKLDTDCNAPDHLQNISQLIHSPIRNVLETEQCWDQRVSDHVPGSIMHWLFVISFAMWFN